MPIKKRDFDLKQSTFQLAGREASFETWKLAVEADSSIRFQYWDTVLLFTSCINLNPNPDSDFMPLMVDFRESFSAGWRIWWALYRRREWRPSDNNILYARMTDRALRPMFPKWMINDVVLSVTPLALDHTIELDVMTIIGSSLATLAAWIPLDWPVGAVQISYLKEEFVVNPTKEQLEEWLFNLLVAGKKWTINMIECGANEVPEKLLKDAFVLAQQEIDKSCDAQSEFLKQLEISKKEITFNKPSQSVLDFVSNIITADKLEQMTGNKKIGFNTLFSQYEREVLDLASDNIWDWEQEDFTYTRVKIAVFTHIKNFLRDRTLQTKKRIDDRWEKDIRPLYCEVDKIWRIHGTWLFRRWETQVLNTVTLWWPTEYLLIEDMEHDHIKQRYFHHYNFPPFSVWEARWTRGQNRREIWHGKLAEKALMPMIPDVDIFPYSIRTVSECLWSWWSTSMWAVCSSTLSLMDAGVPIKKPVAGIAMWLISNSDDSWAISDYMILNDLKWTEDFTWDMDFKVAGTKDWITAIQLDTKLKGITMEIIHQTISRAFEWYNDIMNFMLETISEPRKEVKEYAPKIEIIQVHPDKIKDVIWKWWDVINKIIEDCDNIKIDFEDDGKCFLTHSNKEMIAKAKEIIKEITTDIEIGQIFEWEISRVEDYGLFVDLPKNKKWLVHVSKLWQRYEWPLNKYFKTGTTMKVRVTWIDHQWKIQLKREL